MEERNNEARRAELYAQLEEISKSNQKQPFSFFNNITGDLPRLRRFGYILIIVGIIMMIASNMLFPMLEANNGEALSYDVVSAEVVKIHSAYEHEKTSRHVTVEYYYKAKLYSEKIFDTELLAVGDKTNICVKSSDPTDVISVGMLHNKLDSLQNRFISFSAAWITVAIMFVLCSYENIRNSMRESNRDRMRNLMYRIFGGR